MKARNFPLAVATLALGVGLIGCQSTTPTALAPTIQSASPATELRFNLALMERGSPHPSERAYRERAKFDALNQVAWVDRFTQKSFAGKPIEVEENGPYQQLISADAAHPRPRLRNYTSLGDFRRGIYHTLDSLKTLEHIPLTPR